MKRWILSKLLRPEQLAVLDAMDCPIKWMPDPAITSDEAKTWGNLLRSPLLMKIDTAMVNYSQQQAQTAIMGPAAELPKLAGFALGVREGWQMAKRLSVLLATKAEQSEDGDEGAPDLD